jgi:hypothetical protein
MVRGACLVEVSDALAIGGDLEGGRKLGVIALRLLRLRGTRTRSRTMSRVEERGSLRRN